MYYSWVICFLVSDSKYTGGCKECFGKPPHCPPPLTRQIVFFAAVASAGQSLDFLSLSRRLSVFCAQSTLTLTWLLFFFFSSPLLSSTLCNSGTATAPANCMCCILTLQLTQAWASWGSFWYPAQRLCATFTLNDQCACVCLCVCVCVCLYAHVHMLHPVSSYPWQYHAANKRPPVPVC